MTSDVFMGDLHNLQVFVAGDRDARRCPWTWSCCLWDSPHGENKGFIMRIAYLFDKMTFDIFLMRSPQTSRPITRDSDARRCSEICSRCQQSRLKVLRALPAETLVDGLPRVLS